MLISRTALAGALLLFPGLAGAQRGVPVIDASSGYLLGVVSNGVWRKAETAAPGVAAGVRYRVFGAEALLGTASGGRAVSVEEPCPETFQVELSPAREDAVVALGGGWNVLPRRVQRNAPAAPYRELVRALLVRHGIARPEVRITGVTRVDLDGNGTEEVIVNATRESGSTRAVGRGDYSLLLVRKLVNGTPRTIVLEEEYHPRPTPESVQNTFTLGGVYDLDGDGVYEIIMRGAYYEGGWTTVYRVRGSARQQLASVGCGV
jgi:hypothetical protein